MMMPFFVSPRNQATFLTGLFTLLAFFLLCGTPDVSASPSFSDVQGKAFSLTNADRIPTLIQTGKPAQCERNLNREPASLPRQALFRRSSLAAAVEPSRSEPLFFRLTEIRGMLPLPLEPPAIIASC